MKNGPVTESGSTPARFVEQTRVAAAAQLLKQTQWTQWTQDNVASRNSFGSVDAMRRAFSRLHGMAPQAHRAR
ncbi:helix-turn-helix domain-containing protein [Variovorax sp. OK605]|uniref:helix-turn-helix domain-containing protein n=1 Tax=Variovorax sp. OK605 TaxID=1855317 RepID=UPI0015A6AE24|nr:helix-turn-helix domain-containing protein [Variovorax sp. OK605]